MKSGRCECDSKSVCLNCPQWKKVQFIARSKGQVVDPAMGRYVVQHTHMTRREKIQKKNEIKRGLHARLGRMPSNREVDEILAGISKKFEQSHRAKVAQESQSKIKCSCGTTYSSDLDSCPTCAVVELE